MDVEYAKKIAGPNGVKVFTVEQITDACLTLSKSKIFLPIDKIIRDKKCRPTSIEDQYRLLCNIYSIKFLPFSSRLFASVAAGHKAMESMNKHNVLEAQKRLGDSFCFIEELDFNSNIRKDKTHAASSFFSVLLHVNLWNEDFFGFQENCRRSMDYFSSIDDRSLIGGLYQTCTNISRCYGFGLIGAFAGLSEESNQSLKLSSSVALNKYDEAVNIAKYYRVLTRDIMAKGLLKADTNDIKFQEFKRDLNIFNLMCKIEVSLKNKNFTEFMVNNESLYLSCLRPHVKKKVDHLFSVYNKNLKTIIHENFSILE